jgi:hypothetical protein
MIIKRKITFRSGTIYVVMTNCVSKNSARLGYAGEQMRALCFLSIPVSQAGQTDGDADFYRSHAPAWERSVRSDNLISIQPA